MTKLEEGKHRTMILSIRIRGVAVVEQAGRASVTQVGFAFL